MYRQLLTLPLLLSFLFANNMGEYGWNIPNSSVNIGGYLDITYNNKREERFLFDDIALLFSGEHERFDILGEVELSHISLDGKSNNSKDIDLNLERLQLNYTLSNNHSFQIGRFKSNIGYWNQAPILILQNTTTKPHIVGNFFPEATTGVLYRYNINDENSISFTFQDNSDISHQDGVINVNRHKGFAYYGSKSDLFWCFSLGEFREESGTEAKYIGIGAEYEIDEFEIKAEYFVQDSEVSKKKPFSAYVQPTWHFRKNHDAVMRFESYRDTLLEMKEEIYLLGYVYRPNSNIALKGEYIYHTKSPLNRFVYSFSVLF